MTGELSGQVALVAGATRGAGRALAVELARAGAFVYATGRSSRDTGPSDMDRPETIEETGDLIAAAGGDGVCLRVDHLDVEAVRSLVERIRGDHGQLDVLVNDIFGGDRYAQWDKTLWEHDLGGGLRMLGMGVETHVVTSVLALSPAYVARGVAALAADGDHRRFAGQVLSARQLADEYGVTDTDGSRPDWWGLIAAHGWDDQEPEVIDRFR